MKKLLMTFTLNNILYEVFGKDNKLIINKPNDQTPLSEEEQILIIKAIKEILKKQNMEYNTITYKNETIDIIYDSINDEYILKKGGVICNDKYPELYDSYNNPVFANDEEWTVDNSNHNINESIEENLNPTYSKLEDERLEVLKEKRAKQKKTKKILLSIGGIALSATVFLTSWNTWLKDITNKKSNIEIDTQTQVVTEAREEQTSKQAEDETLVATVKDDGTIEIESTTKENIIEETTEKQVVISDSERIINAIKDNPYITDYYKYMLTPAYDEYISERVKYMSDEEIDKLVDDLSTLKIEEGSLNTDENITGKYFYKSNIIYLYSDYQHTVTHEFLHSLGKYSVYTGSNEENAYVDYITEGYVELHNINRNKNVYSTAQMVYIALEKTYGKDFMEEAYFGRSLLNEMQEKFGSDYESHWELVKGLNEDMKVIGTMNVLDIRETTDGKKEVAYNMVDKLKAEYESVTGKSWDDDETLKCIESCITGQNTMDMDEHEFIVDVYSNEEGDYSYRTIYREDIEYSWTR